MLANLAYINFAFLAGHWGSTLHRYVEFSDVGP